MFVLPTGFSLPPLPYLVGLVGAGVLVTVVIVALDPPITQGLAVGLAPWMAIGGALHAFHQLGAYPPEYAPLFGAPAVYLTTFIITGTLWLLLSVLGVSRGQSENVPRNLGLIGIGVLTVLFVTAVFRGQGLGTLDPVWPAVAIVVALLVTAMVIFGVSLWRTHVFLRTRYVGPVVVFAHALDGVSTAIGADVLGFHERTPIPRTIMQFAGDLPTASVLGVGWLFVLVKIVVAVAVVVAFSDYVDEQPREATLVLSLVAAVGLGPAMNNLFLFLSGAY